MSDDLGRILSGGDPLAPDWGVPGQDPGEPGTRGDQALRGDFPPSLIEAVALILLDLNTRTLHDLPLPPDLAAGRRNLCAAIGVQRNDEPRELIEAKLRAALTRSET